MTRCPSATPRSATTARAHRKVSVESGVSRRFPPTVREWAAASQAPLNSKADPSGAPHRVRMSSQTNSNSQSDDRVLPYEVAEETFVIPELHLVPGQPAVYINSLVIRG